ncbi:MAG TPA: hypothetical protein VM759_07835, partial [Longimicrobium sp.]|nr:hypothetical protein [Longimicrobium sp.]
MDPDDPFDTAAPPDAAIPFDADTGAVDAGTALVAADAAGIEFAKADAPSPRSMASCCDMSCSCCAISRSTALSPTPPPFPAEPMEPTGTGSGAWATAATGAIGCAAETAD